MRRPVVRKMRLLALAAACTALLLLLSRQQRQRSALELLYYPPEQVAPPPPSSQWLAVPPLSATQLPDDRCVFLLETSGRSRLSAREWCAVESVSRADPSLTVVLLLTSPLLRRTSLSDSLLSGNSTLLRQLRLAALFRHTPLHGWYQSRRVLAARWPSAHMSDAVRFALLYRHGGLYLDTDVIVRRPLAGLPDGAGLESEHAIAAGVIKLGRRSPLPRRLAQRLALEYDPSTWGRNGPGVVTAELSRHCRVTGLPLPATRCPQATIYGRRRFYAVPWPDWRLFLEPAARSAVLSAVQDSYVVHTWGSYTRSFAVRKDSAYYTLAEQHCPSSLHWGGDGF